MLVVEPQDGRIDAETARGARRGRAADALARRHLPAPPCRQPGRRDRARGEAQHITQVVLGQSHRSPLRVAFGGALIDAVLRRPRASTSTWSPTRRADGCVNTRGLTLDVARNTRGLTGLLRAGIRLNALLLAMALGVETSMRPTQGAQRQPQAGIGPAASRRSYGSRLYSRRSRSAWRFWASRISGAA